MRFDDIAYPWPERWLDLDGVRICYIVRPAAGESRRPVLLIPPLGRGLMHYRPNLDGLAAIGPVVTFDPPGCGKSHKLGPALDLVDVAGQARVAAAVLQAARRDCALPAALVVGTSYGALVAMALVAARPDLAQPLVLSDAAGARPGLFGRMMSGLFSRELFLRRLGRDAWRRALERMFHDRDHPALAANIELLMKLLSGPDWPDYLTALAHTTRAAMLERPHELIESLQERRPPVLAVWGAFDRITPVAWGRELAARLDAELEIIDQAGHFPNIERPEAFESVVLRFAASCLA